MNQHWEIRFKGIAYGPLDDLLGLRYYHYLMLKPNEWIGYSDILKDCEESPKLPEQSQTPEYKSKEDGDPEVSEFTNRKIPKTTPEAIKRMGRKLMQARRDKEQAKLDVNEAMANDAAQTIDSIMKWMRENTDMRGHSLIESKDERKKKDKVRNNMKTARKKIKKLCPEFHDYLGKHIANEKDKAYIFITDVNNPISWILE